MGHDESDEEVEPGGEGVLAAGELRGIVVESSVRIVNAVGNLLVWTGARACEGAKVWEVLH
eukprot:5644264-Amphidinium_carterae.1